MVPSGTFRVLASAVVFCLVHNRPAGSGSAASQRVLFSDRPDMMGFERQSSGCTGLDRDDGVSLLPVCLYFDNPRRRVRET